MNEEERLTLNNYLEDLYQAMQIGDIVFESKHSSELYDLINKLLDENKKYKEVINKLKKYLIDTIPDKFEIADYSIKRVKDILKEVEHE